MRIPALAALACLAACSTVPAVDEAPPPPLSLEPHAFVARDGRRVDAERGRILVPENRAKADGRRIELSFVRFRSTAARPGPPIVYLAGGPGGAGTGAARGPRFDLFMALRAQADVIAFDQRGTGLSHAPPDCPAGEPVDTSVPLTRETMVARVRADVVRCIAWWRSEGVDVDAYDTRESAADLEDLRRAIGAPKIDLWAISYGTHLGAAYLRDHEERVGRAVFAGYEGPDDTVKPPSGTDAMLARLAATLAVDLGAARMSPDLVATMRRVHAKLDETPAVVTVPARNGATTLTIGAFPVQLLASAMIADPGVAASLPSLYAAMEAGRFEPVAGLILTRLLPELGAMRLMPTAMDLASGASPARLAQVGREAETAVLGDAPNFPMPHIADLAPELDLGAAFRAPLSTRTPVLFISGTLDGRTGPEAARRAMARLPRSRQLIVENGGHNIFEAHPRMAEVLTTWFRDGVAPDRLRLDPPSIPVGGPPSAGAGR